MHANYQPDFDASCKLCGTSPCVIVVDHVMPDTELCGPHFFGDKTMVDWACWNDPQDSTE